MNTESKVPGHVLRDEMKHFGITPSQLSRHMQVSTAYIFIVLGRELTTAASAAKLRQGIRDLVEKRAVENSRLLAELDGAASK